MPAMTEPADPIYYDILTEVVPPDVWRDICIKARDQALGGNAQARKWLGEYLIGKPRPRPLPAQQPANRPIAISIERFSDKHKPGLGERSAQDPG
jgi:hypothetical protein